VQDQQQVEKTKEDLADEFVQRSRDVAEKGVPIEVSLAMDELMRSSYIAGWNECYARTTTRRSE
jgi:hypothetical protein